MQVTYRANYVQSITSTVTETGTNRNYIFDLRRKRNISSFLKACLAPGTVLVPFCVLMVQWKKKREVNSRITPRIALEGEKQIKKKKINKIKEQTVPLKLIRLLNTL